jgi:hypothetical protein
VTDLERDEIDDVMDSLSASMCDVLIRGSIALYGLRFQTGEAMRRRGLLHRVTTYVQKLEFADAKGVHCKYEWPKAHPRASHEWTFTAEGIEAGLRLRNAIREGISR